MSSDQANDRPRTTDRVEELHDLHLLCRQGMLYEVERWIHDNRPIQIAAGVEIRGQYRSALEIALETGQHSFCVLLLRSGYRLDLERDSPLNIVLSARRWDLYDLLLEHGADQHKVDLEILFGTYRTELFEDFYAAGVDLTMEHRMAEALAYHTRNKPLYGFVKRHRAENPAVQKELDIALSYHAHNDKEKGILLCLWAGANPHARVPDLEYVTREDVEEWHSTAIEGAVFRGSVNALKRFTPDPAKIDFDRLYEDARNAETVECLAKIQPPRDITSIMRAMCSRARITWGDSWRGKCALLALLRCGIRWERAEAQRVADIRRDLLKSKDWDFRDVLRELCRPEVCSPEVFHELTRTSSMHNRMIATGVIRPPVKPISIREKRRREIAHYLPGFDRNKLYEDVWSKPVMHVAKVYGVSGRHLAKVCRILNVPVPPRGYWARVRNGQTVRPPPLRVLPKDLRTE